MLGTKNVRRRLGLLAAAGAVMAGTMLTTAAPSQAEVTDCPNGTVCMWEHSNFWGRMFTNNEWANGLDFAREIPRLNDFQMNDIVGSVRNNTGDYWCFFEHENYAGGYVVFPPYTQIQDLGSSGDMFSSAKVC